MIETWQYHWDCRVENHPTQDDCHGPRVRRWVSAPPHTTKKNSNISVWHKFVIQGTRCRLCHKSVAGRPGEPGIPTQSPARESLATTPGSVAPIRVELDQQ